RGGLAAHGRRRALPLLLHGVAHLGPRGLAVVAKARPLLGEILLDLVGPRAQLVELEERAVAERHRALGDLLLEPDRALVELRPLGHRGGLRLLPRRGDLVVPPRRLLRFVRHGPKLARIAPTLRMSCTNRTPRKTNAPVA